MTDRSWLPRVESRCTFRSTDMPNRQQRKVGAAVASDLFIAWPAAGSEVSGHGVFRAANRAGQAIGAWLFFQIDLPVIPTPLPSLKLPQNSAGSGRWQDAFLRSSI